MSEEFKHLGREARPDDLSSLRRLEEERQRAGWRLEGRTPREWVTAFALPLPRGSETAPVDVVARLGLAAVPTLVDTLYTERLAPRPKQDLRIRARCLEALGFGSCLHAACRALSGMSVITLAFGSNEDSPPPLAPEQTNREVRKAIRVELRP